MTAGPHTEPRAPRVLIEHSDYWLTNKGDLAMLDVTITRIRARWPDARVGVLTEAPLLLRAYFPSAEPVTPWGTRPWSEPGLVGRLCSVAGPRLVGPWAMTLLKARMWAQKAAQPARERARRLRARREAGKRPATGEPVNAPEDDAGGDAGRRVPPNTKTAADSASLVLALGGGYLTDADLLQSTRVLDLLEHAQVMHIPTAMVGQGLGPIQQRGLLSRAATVLPGVAFIGLREGRRGPELLRRAGVPTERVAVAGDDAIELSYSVRRDDVGSDIGVCLRVADYSPVSQSAQQVVRSSLQMVARDLHAALSPVIIAEYGSQDRHSTLPLVRGFPAARHPPGRFAPPREVARQVGQCRVLVTGAYHAAVFALAQGVPVVALTSSRYYDDKFLGLAEMFGVGLELVRLEGDGLADRLSSATRSAWVNAPEVRPALRASAQRQIATSRSALERVLTFVETPLPERT